jgi:hypothetical protein
MWWLRRQGCSLISGLFCGMKIAPALMEFADEVAISSSNLKVGFPIGVSSSRSDLCNLSIPSHAWSLALLGTVIGKFVAPELTINY